VDSAGSFAGSSQQAAVVDLAIAHSSVPSGIPHLASSHALAPAPSPLPCSVSKPESFKLLYHVLEIIPAYRWEDRRNTLFVCFAAGS
jgi:hypothetical protein